ncbi:general stress protein [Neobacillus mesonae]|nr:general stress protein [Neobacillus mesonae]
MAKQKVVGIFETEEEASRAIEQLMSRGYSNEEISVITRSKEDQRAIESETGTKAPEGIAAGAATGGVLGGVTGLLAGIGALAIPGVGPILAAGPIAATLTGAAVGAGAGGLVGGLVGLGIPEDEAREYEQSVEEGRILVLVDQKYADTDVYGVFRDNRSLNADRYDRQADNLPGPNRVPENQAEQEAMGTRIDRTMR